MEFTATTKMVDKVRQMAGELMEEVRAGRRWVKRKRLSSFCGVEVSMLIPLPLARYYTRSLYDGLRDWSRAGEWGTAEIRANEVVQQSRERPQDMVADRRGREADTGREGHPGSVCAYGCSRAGVGRNSIGAHRSRNNWR